MLVLLRTPCGLINFRLNVPCLNHMIVGKVLLWVSSVCCDTNNKTSARDEATGLAVFLKSTTESWENPFYGTLTQQR